jgi:uncharacterized repeat protein (TIGR01451 family)
MLAALLLACVTLATVLADGSPAAAGPPPVMYGYVPLPADDMQGAMESVNTAATTTLDFTVGITNAAPGSVMYYDQWEDGFESDIANPSQASTLVFGDANTANGNAATYCPACAGDLLPQGAPVIMRNSITTPRSSAQVRFDGGDKVASTRGFAITAGGFTSLGSVLSGVVSAYDTTLFATDYTVPVGEDTPVPAGTSDAFSYTGMSVMAANDATTVEVDTDGDGVVDLTEVIDEAETVFVNGGLAEGAHVRSSAPVQVHLATGERGSSYESRWFTLFPDHLLSDDYLSPAGSGVGNFRTVNYLFNPSGSPIVVTPGCPSCSGTISVPAGASAAFHSPIGEAVRFTSSGEPFIAVAGVGAQSGAAPGGGSDQSATWDWGLTMIPTSLLTTQVVLGWAPGNSNNPPSSPSANRDDDPVWITSLAATTIRVDFDGDPTTGSISTPDCFGARHDLELSVSALLSTRIHDSVDGDMTGSRIYTCDGTVLAGAWGEDPASAPAGSPGFDAGYTIIPTTAMIVEKTAVLADDRNADGEIGPGDQLTYEIAIADASSLAFTSVVAEDVLPAGMSYVPGSTTFDDGATTVVLADDLAPPASTIFPLDEGGVSLPDVAAGQTVYLRFDAAIDDPWPGTGATIGNTACVTAAEAADCDTESTHLVEADLSLAKTEVAGPARVGDDAVFEITVANSGPDDAPGVVVTDLLPSELSLVSASPSVGTYDPVTGVWTVGTVSSATTATLVLTATVGSADPITNVAEVTAAQAVDPDSQPAENALGPMNPADQDDESSATVDVDPPHVDLSLTKTVLTAPAHVGDIVVFELTLANAGPSDATGAEVTDLLPAGLSFDGALATVGTYDDASGVWTVGDLASGATESLLLAARTDAGSITNHAEVTAVDQPDADSTPSNGVAGEDDQASAAVTASPLADLSLSKVLISTPVHLGDSAVFELTVSNAGPSDATGVVVSEQLPPGLAHLSDDGAGAYEPSSGTWAVGTVPAGGARTLTLTTRVDALAVDNLAEITAANEDDPDSQPAENPFGPSDPADQDDEAAVSLTVEPLADLSLAKTSTPTTVTQLDTATFTLAVSNAGPSDATGVVVTDLLPAGLAFAGATPSHGTYDPGTGAWAIGDLPNGAAATLTISVQVLDAGTIVNIAEVTAVTEDDPDSFPGNADPAEDDQDASALSSDPLIDLSVAESVSAPAAVVGGTVTYTFTVANDGPSDATGVQLAALLPAGVTYVADAPAQGTYDPATGLWDVGDLPVGTSTSLSVTVEVRVAGPIDGFVEVIAADQPDVDSAPAEDPLGASSPPNQDDEATATVVGILVDLELDLEFDAASVLVGGPVTSTVTVTNRGPSDATGVNVTEVVPVGLTMLTSTPSRGTYDPVTGTWTVGGLAAGETATLEIVAVVAQAGPITARAEVTAANEPDVDSTPANAGAGEDDVDTATVVGEAADLSLDKSVDITEPDLGDTVTYRLTLTNHGPAAATHVVVRDELPTGVTWLNDTAAGAYDHVSGRWSVPWLPAGATTSVDITVRVGQASAIANRASVDSVDQPDPDSQPGNVAPSEDDEDTVTIQPRTASLAGTIWRDDDRDGVHDPGESAIPGVVVALLNSDGNLVATVVTDATGSYSVGGLTPATYTLVVDPSTLPAGVSVQSADPDGVNDHRHVLTLAAGENVAELDFAFAAAPAAPATTTTSAPAASTGTDLPGAGSDPRHLLTTALLLVGAGGILLLVRSRRRRC